MSDRSAASKAVTVALADSNPLMLGALSEYLERDRRFSLVATSKTAEGFLELVLRSEIAVGIIDWTLPGLGGERLCELFRNREVSPRMVVYAHDPQAEIARRAMASGAAGFCSRSEPPERLLDIVAEVAGGRMVFPFLDVRTLRRDPMDSLTERERTLMGLLAKGYSNKQLARELSISVNTVKFHLRSVFEKLAVNSRAQAIAFYYSSPDRQAAAQGGAPFFDED